MPERKEVFKKKTEAKRPQGWGYSNGHNTELPGPELRRGSRVSALRPHPKHPVSAQESILTKPD